MNDMFADDILDVAYLLQIPKLITNWQDKQD